MPGLTDAHWHMTRAANTMASLEQADEGCTALRAPFLRTADLSDGAICDRELPAVFVSSPTESQEGDARWREFDMIRRKASAIETGEFTVVV
jgi:hypothetical protein